MKKIFAVVLLALLFIASIGSNASSPVIIQFWNGIGPPEADVLSDFVKDFNEKYKGKIIVEETLLNWDAL